MGTAKAPRQTSGPRTRGLNRREAKSAERGAVRSSGSRRGLEDGRWRGAPACPHSHSALGSAGAPGAAVELAVEDAHPAQQQVEQEASDREQDEALPER